MLKTASWRLVLNRGIRKLYERVKERNTEVEGLRYKRHDCPLNWNGVLLLLLMNLFLHCVLHRTSQTKELCNGLQQSYGRYAAHRPPSTIGKVSVSLITTQNNNEKAQKLTSSHISYLYVTEFYDSWSSRLLLANKVVYPFTVMVLSHAGSSVKPFLSLSLFLFFFFYSLYRRRGADRCIIWEETWLSVARVCPEKTCNE